METLLILLGALFLIGLIVGLIKLIFDVIVEIFRFSIIIGAAVLVGYLAYILTN